MFVSFVTACLVTAAAFCPMNRKLFIKTAAAFFLFSFGYCGAMIAVWILFSPDNLIIRNSSVYIAVSPTILILTTIICYIIMRVILRITQRGRLSDEICSLKINYNGKEVICSGKVDTGNTLQEPFSGDSVIVVRSGVFEDVKSEISTSEKNGFRVVPYTSVGGQGIMKAFKAEQIIINTSKGDYKAEAYIALCKEELITGDADALIPSELII